MNPDTPGGRGCSAPGCDRPFRARGFCAMHYRHEFGRGPKRELMCSWCGGTFVGGDEGKSENRYCSRRHEAAAKHARQYRGGPSPRPRPTSCPVAYGDCRLPSCGRTFTKRPHDGTRVFCSSECRYVEELARARARYVPRRNNGRWGSVECACGCGRTVVRSVPSHRFFSEKCRLREQSKRDRHRRRAARRGSVAPELTDLGVIATRDRWRCHICRKRVARRSATLDHLIPVSAGGLHIPENLALAHRSCNSRRGTGRIPAQLRMVG